MVLAAEVGQGHRHGPGLGVLTGVQERSEEIVPGVEEAEQGDRCDGRFGQRHNDLEQDAPLTRAVDASRVDVLLRDGQQELPEQEDRESVTEEARDDQRRERPDQMQLGEHDVERHGRDLGRQHHRGEDQDERRAAPAPLQPGQGVRRRDTRDHDAQRRQPGVDHRVDAGSHQSRLGEHVNEVLRVQWRRMSWVGRLVGGHERREEHERQRRQEHDGENDQDAALGDDGQDALPAGATGALSGSGAVSAGAAPSMRAVISAPPAGRPSVVTRRATGP